MKKHISISAVVLMLSLTFTSCKKHKQGTVNYQTIEINLDALLPQIMLPQLHRLQCLILGYS